MDMDKLKSYYNQIESCSVSLQKEIDFDYIQEQITKMALHTETLNTLLGEVLISQTELEHEITEKKFKYELEVNQYLRDNVDVKKIATAKERKDFVNYFLMKDQYKELLDLDQQVRDIDKLLDLAKKKSRDLDRTYPKLKTLWDSLSMEIRHIKKIGSDFEHIERVRNKILDENLVKPIFTDAIVEELEKDQYYKEDKLNDNLAEFDSSITDEVDDLLKDL